MASDSNSDTNLARTEDPRLLSAKEDCARLRELCSKLVQRLAEVAGTSAAEVKVDCALQGIDLAPLTLSPAQMSEHNFAAELDRLLAESSSNESSLDTSSPSSDSGLQPLPLDLELPFDVSQVLWPGVVLDQPDPSPLPGTGEINWSHWGLPPPVIASEKLGERRYSVGSNHSESSAVSLVPDVLPPAPNVSPMLQVDSSLDQLPVAPQYAYFFPPMEPVSMEPIQLAVDLEATPTCASFWSPVKIHRCATDWTHC
ncbi:hypothetical protein T439DRAFT_379443 [Meredithblackwellia eburnea MCA 4105]